VGLRRRRDLHRGPVRLDLALFRDREEWKAEKVITVPAEPADPDLLPPALKPFSAVPSLLSDIDLSVDDRFLYVSCWGTGEMKQFDVSDPARPTQAGSVRLGGIVDRAPTRPGMPLAGGPQMVEVSASPTRSTAPGTTSSTPTESAPGWPSSTQAPTAG
jgi:hypothetical protein